MNNLIFISTTASLIFLSTSLFGQSKKELQETISNLEEKIQKLENEKISANEEIKRITNLYEIEEKKTFKLENTINKYKIELENYKKNSPKHKLENALKLLANNKQSEAIYSFEKIIREFPLSQEAAEAKNKLNEFEKEKIVEQEKIIETLCSKIRKRYDEINGSTTVETPSFFGDYCVRNITLYKIIDKYGTTYNLSLNTEGSTLNIGEKGIVILFSDGTKIEKNTKVDVDVSSGQYKYSTWLTLTTSELKTLQNKKIKKFRLFIYDESISDKDAAYLQKYAECIESIK